MSDATRVTLTVDGPATVKVNHHREPVEPEPEPEQEQQREHWWPTVVSEDGLWESFK